MAGEALAIILAAVAAKLLYIDWYLGASQSIFQFIPPTLLLAAIVTVLFLRMGLDAFEAVVAPVLGYGRLVGGLAFAFLVLLGILYVSKLAEEYSRGWYLCWFVLSAVGLITVRSLARLWLDKLAAQGRLSIRTALSTVPQSASKNSR